MKIVVKSKTFPRAGILFVGLLLLITVYIPGRIYGQSENLELPLRGAFYYPWYSQTWTVGGKHVFYEPELGYYSSDDEKVVEQHIEDMDYAKIDLAIASWWGIDKQHQETRFPLLLNETTEAGSKLKWAFYYEKEGYDNPTVEALESDLDYLMDTYGSHEAMARINGKPVIFVYCADDQTCEVADRWTEAARGKWYVNLKVFGGFRNCTNQPDSWHQYGPATATQEHKGYSFVISPGFWRADEATARLERDSARWYANVREMSASNQPWQLVTTFNEWGEGTAIERCYDWQSKTKFGIYLDALHTDGVNQPVTSMKDDVTGKEILCYHNPFSELLIVSNEAGMVEIYNVNGSLVKRLENQNQGSLEISTRGFNRGVYFVRMTLLSGKQRALKFLK